MISKLKIFLSFLVLSLMLLLGFFIYRLGKSSAKIDCKEQEIQVQTKIVEVVKYLYKEDAKVYIRPNSSFKELLDRMERGEI